MRLPPDRIKQGILHADRAVREAAVAYFSDAFLPDSTVMPLVIQAVEKYGTQHAFSPERFPENLPQTDETARWLLSQVSRIAQSHDEFKDERRMLYSFLLAGADADLLARLEPAIHACEALHERARRVIYERVKLRSATADHGWQELEAFCERHKDDEFVNEADLVYAYALVDALARHGDSQSDRVLETLDIEVPEAEASAMGWMEGLAVRLAGEMRLDQATAKIVEKLSLEGEWLSEECERALIRIGTDNVVQALAAEYREASGLFRDFAATTLERVYSELCVPTCRELIDFESEDDLRVLLHYPLVSNFDSDGMEQTRQFLRSRSLPREWEDLRSEFLAVATLMKFDVPERQAWEAESKRTEEYRQSLRVPEFPVVDSVDDLIAQQKKLEEQRRRRQEQALQAALPIPPSLFRRQTKVGRNDPCPCGSGKKYKACCMRRKA